MNLENISLSGYRSLLFLLLAFIIGLIASVYSNLLIIIFSCSTFLFLFGRKSIYILYTIVILLAFRDINIGGAYEVKLVDFVIIISLPFIFVNYLYNKVKIIQKINGITISSFLFIGFSITSLMWSEDLQNGIIEGLKLIIALVLLMSPLIFVQDREKLIRVLEIWLYAASASSLYNLITMNIDTLTFDFLNQTSAFYGFKASFSKFYRDGNDFAMYLILTYTIYHILKNINRKKIKLYNVIIIPVLINWVLSLSRSGWILGLLVFFVLLLLKLNNRLKEKNKSSLLFTSVFFIIIGLLLSILYQIGGINTKADWSFFSRFYLWGAALQLFFLNPLVGVGLGAYQFHALHNINDLVVQLNPFPHNLFLRILAEFGIIGFLLFIGMIAQIFKFIYLKGVSQDKRIIYIIFLLGITAYLIQGFVVEFLSSRYFWLYLGIFNYVISMRGEFLNERIDYVAKTD